MIIRHAEKTDIGNWREKNEDSLLISESLGLYAVADGMGGHVGGGLASRLSLEALEGALGRLKGERNRQDPDTTQRQPLLKRFFAGRQDRDSTEETLRAAIEEANRAVVRYGRDNPIYKGMGTTLTSVWVEPSDTVAHAYVGNVGDSRTYLLRDNGLAQVTEDHSWVQEQVREGKLTSLQADAHYLKNVVTRCIGIQEKIDVDVFKHDLREGDRYLLCSDGLTNMLRDEEIAGILREPDLDEVVNRFVEQAKFVGGLDNITVVVVELFRL